MMAAGLKIILHNIRSMRAHMGEFELMIESMKRDGIHADLIVLTETWIQEHECSRYELEGI